MRAQGQSQWVIMGARRTRLPGMGKMPFPHAALKAGLSESKCSPILCPRPRFLSAQSHYDNSNGVWGLCPHVHSLSLTFCPANQNCSCPFSLLHPNDRAAEIAVAICGAENQPARGQMLSRAVPAAHVFPANCIPIIIQGVWGPAPMAKNGP